MVVVTNGRDQRIWLMCTITTTKNNQWRSIIPFIDASGMKIYYQWKWSQKSHPETPRWCLFHRLCGPARCFRYLVSMIWIWFPKRKSWNDLGLGNCFLQMCLWNKVGQGFFDIYLKPNSNEVSYSSSWIRCQDIVLAGTVCIWVYRVPQFFWLIIILANFRFPSGGNSQTNTISPKIHQQQHMSTGCSNYPLVI